MNIILYIYDYNGVWSLITSRVIPQLIQRTIHPLTLVSNDAISLRSVAGF